RRRLDDEVSRLHGVRRATRRGEQTGDWAHTRGRLHGHSAYQRNFRLICPMRPALALVTRPKFPLVKLPVGLLNCACSNALKNSARNCTDMLSRTRVTFCNPMSQLLNPGPWKKRALELPIVPRFSELNALLLKY